VAPPDTPDAAIPCPVCAAAATLLDVVDLNKSCEENRGVFLPTAGVPIRYFLCDACGFCFAPDMHRWPIQEFADRIYNDDYKLVDPDYVDLRPRLNAKFVADLFASQALAIRHLDYGGGSGLLSNELFAAGWDSTSYDPFVDGPLPADLGRFNLVTCFEVFEHVPDVNQLAATLASLVADDGMVLFSTLLSDGIIARDQSLQWWYAAPRNGHISLFSRQSLALLGQRAGLNLVSLNPSLHAFWLHAPSWAMGIFKSI